MTIYSYPFCYCGPHTERVLDRLLALLHENGLSEDALDHRPGGEFYLIVFYDEAQVQSMQTVVAEWPALVKDSIKYSKAA